MVDFAMGIYEDHSKLWMRKPEISLSWTTFIDVFAMDFWATFYAMFFGLTIILFIIFFFNRESAIPFSTSLATIFLSFVAMGIPVHPRCK